MVPDARRHDPADGVRSAGQPCTRSDVMAKDKKAKGKDKKGK
jgi:hypothetical protein